MQDKGEYFGIRDRTLTVELFYPRQDDEPNGIEIDLVDVRASDGIRVRYDFDRDGWVIEQPTRFEWKLYEQVDFGWKESAFVPSWKYIQGEDNEG